MVRWVWLVTIVAAGCSFPADDPTPTPPQPSPTTTSAAPAPAGDATLAELRVEPRPSYDDSYRRDAFGEAWADIDGNGCNQRDDVLLRDAVDTTVQPQGACDHDVVAGTWIDPYTGAELTFDDLKEQSQAQAIQIDHVVPLAEAWISGARDWGNQRRREFANDLDNLLAVDGPANQSKRADDPAAWRPRKEFQCSYAERWIRVKRQWDLAVDPSERDALADMLGYCADG